MIALFVFRERLKELRYYVYAWIHFTFVNGLHNVRHVLV